MPHFEFLKSHSTSEIIEKFAEDEQAFHEAFAEGFFKIGSAGQETTDLISINELYYNHEDAVLRSREN